MQILPSPSVLAALSHFGQAQAGARGRHESPDGTSRATAAEPALPATFERPPEGAPVRRGMLVDIRA